MLGPNEIKRLIEGDTDPTRRAVSYLSYAGLGVGEIHGLRWGAVRAEAPKLPSTAASRGLTYDQARELLTLVRSSDNLRDQVIVEMALVCGLRQVELRRVRLGDLRTRNGRLFILIHGKGWKKREVFAPAPLQGRINRLLAGEGRHLKWVKMGKLHPSRHLLQSNMGAGLSENGIRLIFDRYLPKVSDTATPHCLRHTCITWLLNTGATLEQAMEIAGHSEASSHEIYAAVDDSWFIRSWQKTHPIAKWGVGIGCVRICGKKYERRMSRGTERVVPLPMEVVGAVRNGFREGGLAGAMSRRMLAWIYKDLELNPSMLRKAGAVHMAEAGAHVFLISMILGITPGRVISNKFDRKGTKAEDGRVGAVERAVNLLYQDNVVDLGVRSA